MMEGSVLIKALNVKIDELFSIQPQSLHVVRRRDSEERKYLRIPLVKRARC